MGMILQVGSKNSCLNDLNPKRPLTNDILHTSWESWSRRFFLVIQANTETEVSEFGVWILYLGLWFQIFFIFTPILGKMNPFWLIFFKWVVQPPTRYVFGGPVIPTLSFFYWSPGCLVGWYFLHGRHGIWKTQKTCKILWTSTNHLVVTLPKNKQVASEKEKRNQIFHQNMRKNTKKNI